LNEYHKDEVPNIDKAINVILSQTDKVNYTKVRDEYIKSVKELLC